MWHLNYFLRPRSAQWYESLFAPGKDRVIRRCHAFVRTYGRESDCGYQKDFPDLKIIYILRNPIDRTWSHILLRCLGLVGWQTEELTEEVVRKTVFERDLNDQWLFSNGYYMENLSRWEKYFPPEQLFVGFYDDLKQNPRQFLSTICEFLQIEGSLNHQTQQLETRYNEKPIQLPIQPDIEAIFSNIYLEELQHLAKRFGGVTSDWLNRAQNVLEDTPQNEG